MKNLVAWWGAGTGSAALLVQAGSYRRSGRTAHSETLRDLHDDLLRQKKSVEWWRTMVTAVNAPDLPEVPAALAALGRMESMARSLSWSLRRQVQEPVSGARVAFESAGGAHLALGLDAFLSGSPVGSNAGLMTQFETVTAVAVTKIDAAISAIERSRR